MSGDRITTGMDAVVVRVTADDGTVGLGESGTVGVTYDAQNFPGQDRRIDGAGACPPRARPAQP